MKKVHVINTPVRVDELYLYDPDETGITDWDDHRAEALHIRKLREFKKSAKG
ncbi:hypothetical protein KY385_02785 [Candidatus Parcubacteria bacterium]|nr:hypothetical protein [Candidatus Parcubacteria bacterium]